MGSFPGGRDSEGGVQLELAANQAIATGTAADTLLTWHATPLWDPDGIWTGGAANEFVVPANWDYIRVLGNVRFAVNTTGSRRIRVLINGADNALHGNTSTRTPQSSSQWRGNVASGIIAVSENDTVKIGVIQDSGGNLNAEKNNETWIAILKWVPRGFVHADLTAVEPIADNTLTEIPFDRAVRDDFALTETPGWLSADPTKIVVPGGSRRYRVYAGFEMETAAGTTFMSLDQSNGTAHTGPTTSNEKGQTDSNVKNYDCWNGPVIQNPSFSGQDNTFRLKFRQQSGGEQDLAAGTYLQIEDARDSFIGVDTKSADQTITTATTTVISQNENVISDDAGFNSGAANTLRVPAKPGGGSWAFGLIYMGQPLDIDTNGERFNTMEIDTGGGFAAFKGVASIIYRNSGAERGRVAIIGFYPAPATGDEFRLTTWQNSGSDKDILGNANSQYFALELFR